MLYWRCFTNWSSYLEAVPLPSCVRSGGSWEGASLLLGHGRPTVPPESRAGLPGPRGASCDSRTCGYVYTFHMHTVCVRQAHSASVHRNGTPSRSVEMHMLFSVLVRGGATLWVVHGGHAHQWAVGSLGKYACSFSFCSNTKPSGSLLLLF